MHKLGLVSLEEEEARLARLVYVEDGYIIVNSGDKHDFDLNTCNSYASLIEWVLYLTNKSWATNEIIRRFLLLAIEHNYLAYSGDAAGRC